MALQNPPVVKTQILIRRPVAEVFAAFVDPAVTTKFWFTKSSGRLEPGKEVRWDWEMFGVGTQVRVKAVEQDRRILIEWDDPPCPVEWLFAPRGDDTTFVTISNWGFQGSDDEVVAKALDSMGGFSFALAGLKALLEHGVALNLVADHHPDAAKAQDAVERKGDPK
ncbi:polyketide cyclase [bacterium]|nr:MAG: polyketide cyclase [bacterium]